MNDNRIIKLKGLSKAFPGVIALDNVNFDLKYGEVHAVLGENGAGKSTLIKIICGVYKKDTGDYVFENNDVDFKNPKEALDIGICAIYQELENILKLTIAENIFLGTLPKNRRLPAFIDWNYLYKKTKDLLDEFGINLDPRKKLYELSIAQQQLIEVAKALSRQIKVLIMDEPTSSLSGSDVDFLFKIINSLKEQGKSIIYISHKLNEVLSIADRISVLRDGKSVGTVEKKDFNENEIINMMIGHGVAKQKKYYPKNLEKVLEIKSLNIYKRIDKIDITLHKGEILGIAGLTGCGKDELIKSLAGMWPYKSKGIFINGKKVKINNPSDAIAYNIAYLPEERKVQSIFPTLSVYQNFSVIWLFKIFKNFFISRKKEILKAQEFIKKLSIKVSSINQKIINLSGGNQQKILISRLLVSNPLIFLLHDPTRGIDVGSKEQIWSIIRDLSSKGASVVYLSSEISEICDLSDRIIVLSKGKIIKEFKNEEILYENVLAKILTS